MKVAVCTPLKDEPEPLYSQCLEAMRAYTAQERPDIELIYGSRRGTIVENRNRLTSGALQCGADWLLWIDSDMTFPPDTLLRLIEHGVDLVGCNCARRQRPTSPTAYRMGKNGRQHVWTTPASPDLEPIMETGLAVCLVSSELMRKIPEPWFIESKEIGEDYQFFRVATKAGFQPYVDHRLSWKIGHIHEGTEITNADAMADRPDFLERLYGPDIRRIRDAIAAKLRLEQRSGRR